MENILIKCPWRKTRDSVLITAGKTSGIALNGSPPRVPLAIHVPPVFIGCNGYVKLDSFPESDNYKVRQTPMGTVDLLIKLNEKSSRGDLRCLCNYVREFVHMHARHSPHFPKTSCWNLQIDNVSVARSVRHVPKNDTIVFRKKRHKFTSAGQKE